MELYDFEDGETVHPNQLRAGRMSVEDYAKAHEHLVIPAHDVFVQYREGVLLVTRDNVPAKGERFPLGGRLIKGYRMEDSLRLMAKKESNLDLLDIRELGHCEHFWRTDPFGHGRGTQHIVHVFFARGSGVLSLDELHKDPKIVTPDKYSELRGSLHRYVRDFMDTAFNM
jgi:ADP-ribose pyrophosphatase YjhB (NUDIX family)